MRVERYTLFLDLDPAARRFRGRVGVELQAESLPLRLNAVDLTIDEVRVDGRPAPFEVDAEAQELRVTAETPGAHRLDCAFEGRILPNGLTGVYVSPFGTSSEILTTQMYPTGARRTFPCRDAPAEKAEFDVTVRVPREAHVVFNTDPEEVREEAGHRTVRFHRTPRMSTYLIYLGIGPFEESQREGGGLRTIVAHPRGRSAAAAFALDHAERFVREYEAYYAIPYPLPKLHLVAVPSFWAGAMENWGAIAFRETTLLVDPTTDSFARRWNRQVLAHEIAHQWFGNLVTNAWWNDFWLNEAFATFVAARIVDRVHPGDATWEDFVAYETARGFAQDALDAAHPIEVEIRRPEEIGEIADGITYGKGASLLRMIESYLGEAAFRAGVTAYLNEHRYGAATGADLWASLDRHSEAPVSRIMGAWVGRPGHPVVEVDRRGGGLELVQRRFRYDDGAPDAPWPIPIELDVDGRRERRLLETERATWPVPDGARILVNPDRPGFYHVRYSPELSRSVLGRWGELSDLDRWGLLVDRSFFLASGDATLEEYLEVVERIPGGAGYLPAISAARQLRGFAALLPTVPRLRGAHAAFFRAMLERLGPARRAGESPSDGVLRNEVARGALDSLGDVAEELARQFREAEGTIDPDLLDPAAFAFVRTGGAPAWRAVRERIPAAPSDEVAQRLARALAETRDAGALDATLELLDGPELSASRIWDVVRIASQNAPAAERVWRWYEERLPRLAERWQGTPLLSLLLPEALPSVGLGRSARVRAYFADHAFPEADRGVREGLERLVVRERLAERLRAAPG